MKYILCVALIVGLAFATTTLIVERAIMDDGTPGNSSGFGFPQGTMVDSCGNQYSMALQLHECCAYDPTNDMIGIVNRNFDPTGILNYHSAPGDLSFWVHDYAVYNADFGNGRYPTAIAGTQGPYLSFPWLTSIPSWGGAGAQYCSGGWYSQFWDDPVDLMPGSYQIQTVIGKELPTGDICFICYSTSPWGFYYRTFSADLGTQQAGGRLTPPADTRYYVGWDCNLTAGIAIIVYTDPDLNMYYQTTTDGVTWSGEQTYNLIWPTPYANNEIYHNNGMQAVVTDAGNPLIVFAIMNGDNLEYPQDGKVYVCHTEGQPCVEINNPSDPKNFYPTIATAGNYAAVTYLESRTAQQDSQAFHDMYFVQSTDQGLIWGTPQNMTSSGTQRISFPQLAKRFDASRARAYSVYATCRLPSEDMDLMWAYDNGVAPSIYVNFLELQVGIEENETDVPSKLTFNLFPNPAADRSYISYALPVSGNVSLKLFSVDGRLVKMIEQCHKPAGVYSADLRTSELANGTYFLVLDTEAGKQTRSIVVVH